MPALEELDQGRLVRRPFRHVVRHRPAVRAVAAKRFRVPDAELAELREPAPEVVVFPTARCRVVVVTAGARPGPARDERHRVDVVARHQSRGIEGKRSEDRRRVAELLDRRMGEGAVRALDQVEQRQAARRQEQVVGVERHHERGTGRGKGGVARRSEAAVPLRAFDPDAAEPRSMLLGPADQRFDRMVRRAVVDHHELERRQGLCRDRVEGLGDEMTVILRGERDRDLRGRTPIVVEQHRGRRQGDRMIGRVGGAMDGELGFAGAGRARFMSTEDGAEELGPPLRSIRPENRGRGGASHRRTTRRIVDQREHPATPLVRGRREKPGFAVPDGAPERIGRRRDDRHAEERGLHELNLALAFHERIARFQRADREVEAGDLRRQTIERHEIAPFDPVRHPVEHREFGDVEERPVRGPEQHETRMRPRDENSGERRGGDREIPLMRARAERVADPDRRVGRGRRRAGLQRRACRGEHRVVVAVRQDVHATADLPERGGERLGGRQAEIGHRRGFPHRLE